MTTENNNLYMFQKNLDEDVVTQKSFVTAEVDESESEEESCKIVLPKRCKKNDTSQELLFQLIHQNNILAKTHKKMYKIQAEIDKEEVVTRYIKLDLNNAHVKLRETKDKLGECKKELKCVRIENWIIRCLFVFYVLYQFYCLVKPAVE